MLYVPNFEDNQCVVINNSETIRVYETQPTYNTSINYTDYYVNSHYMANKGTQQFTQYTNIPTCISNEYITTAYMYRNDIADILITFVLLVLIIYIPMDKIIKAFFRGRKLY